MNNKNSQTKLIQRNIIYQQRQKSILQINSPSHSSQQLTQMQPTVQQTEPKQSLRQEDISTIIKHFSFTIQQRFEEIQKNCNYFTCLNSINYQRTDLEKDILCRYSDYKTTNEHEIKLLQKFVERLLQIFQFFRHKTQQPQILHAMGDKITEKLRQILKNQSNCHFFVNNRPKTHSTNVKPFANRSASNDFLSIVGPVCKQQLDLTAVFINNGKKVRTQTTQQKRTVEVGKLFKYVFSVLKRGFLIKLRMQKPEKKVKPQGPKQLSCIEQANTISVEGTCAILRNCSQKGNKQTTAQVQAIRMLISSKQKPNIISGYQNKKQFYIYQKTKNRSVSTNQYSVLSKQNPSALKQSTSKLRELDKKVGILYEIMNIEKYSVVRVAKDPQLSRKDQLKRNSWVQGESRKYQVEFNRWANKCSNSQVEIGGQKFQHQDFITPNNEEADCTFTYDRNLYSSNNYDQIIESSMKQTEMGDVCDTSQFQNSADYDNRDLISKTFKTQQVQETNPESGEKPIQPEVHTLIVCSSRNYSRKDSVLADKTSNLMDIDRNDSRFKEFKNRSSKQERSDRKSLRLNLPCMLGDKSNLLNEPNVRLANLTNQQKNHRVSQKSQFYLQNYHIDGNDDNSFVPLLPKREKNTQNIFQSKNESVSIKRKNLVPNFHPLNRCRIFREKKVHKNYTIIQGTEAKISCMDESIIKGKIRNSLL